MGAWFRDVQVPLLLAGVEDSIKGGFLEEAEPKQSFVRLLERRWESILEQCGPAPL
jgi:hypothetical protein